MASFNFSSLADFGKQYLLPLLLLAIFLLVYFQPGPLEDFLDTILGGRKLQTAQFGSVKLEFSEETIKSAVRPDLFQHLKENDKREIHTQIQKLEPSQVVRLLNIELVRHACNYRAATPEMAEDFATDITLASRGLVERNFSDELKLQTLKAVQDNEKREKKASPIGYPEFCYDLNLTPRGYDVRTAIISVLASTFPPESSQGVASNAPKASEPSPHNPHEKKKQ